MSDQSGQPIFVSLVEDNRYVRAGWEETLKRTGDIVVLGAFESCEAAFQSETLGQSDVVLMDIGLPGMSGIEGVRYLGAQFPRILVVMCTVFDDDQNVFEAVRAGAIGYLLKKSKPEELVAAIRDAVKGGSPMTPNIARKVIGSFQKSPRKQTADNDILTEREERVLELMAIGKSYAAIASEVYLSIDGVRYHIRHIYEKLQVHSRTEAIAKGLKDGLIAPPR